MTAAVQLAQMGNNNPTFRNRIINGAMMIDQRNAGASLSATNGSFSVDRWNSVSYDSGSQTGKFTMQQNAGSVTPPAGFKNYLGVTSSAATSVGAGGIYSVGQGIEGFNIADLGWGAAGASSVTVSFWVRSSLTGTFAAGLGNDSNNYNYPFSYTISSANTWEYKTVTIPGPTAGTWLSTNGAGVYLRFGLGAGSSWSQPAGSWTTSSAYVASGGVSVVGTNGATFYITGVQLEKGTTATPFEYRLYGTELALCQRYYQTIGSQPGAGGNSPISATGMWYNSTTAFMPIRFGVAMRAGPTVSYSSLSEITLYQSTTGVNPTNVYINVAYPTVADLRLTVASGGTSGQATVMQVNGGDVKGVFFSAEL